MRLTSSMGIGLATTYNCSITITHGADRICLTGICNLTFPINPAFITTGSPKYLKASFFRGRFSNSTFPEKQKLTLNEEKIEWKNKKNSYLIKGLYWADLYWDAHTFPNNCLKPKQQVLPTWLFNILGNITILGTENVHSKLDYFSEFHFLMKSNLPKPLDTDTHKIIKCCNHENQILFLRLFLIQNRPMTTLMLLTF